MALGLNYRLGAIRADEESGWVGLGWTLTGTGAVTRTIVGLPDEACGVDIKSDTWLESGLTDDVMQYLDDLFRLKKDASLDRYSYYFPGGSGSFIIAKGQIVELPQSNNTIEFVGDTTDGVRDFRIVTPDGVAYEFTEREHSHFVYTPAAATSDPTPDYTAVTSWHLSRITTAEGADVIEYSYVTMPRWSRSNYRPSATLTMTDSNDGSGCRWVGTQAAETVANNYTEISDRKIISGITSRTGSVTFGYDSPSATSQFISSIKLLNYRGAPVKSVTLSAGGDRRRQLTAITVTDADGTLVRKESMEYHADNASSAGDIFGYANHNKSDDYDIKSAVHPATGALNPRRRPNAGHLLSGALRQTTSTFGVITTYEYEPNAIPFVSNRQKSIGRSIPVIDDPLIPIDSGPAPVDTLITIGLRLKRITAEDAVTGVKRVRSLDYADGCADIDFSTLSGCDFVAMSGMTSHRVIGMLTVTDRSYSATMLFGSRLPGAPVEGARIFYGNVTEWISGSDITRSIRTDYEFDNSRCQLRHYEVGKSYASANTSESDWERSLSPAGIPAGGLSGRRGFGFQSPVNHYFREHIGGKAELLSCTTYEYRDNQYRPTSRQTYTYRTIDASEVVVGLHHETLVRRKQNALSPITANDWQSIDDISHFNICVEVERRVCHQCVATKYFPDGSSRESSTTYLYTEADQLIQLDRRDLIWQTDSICRISQKVFPIGSIRREAGITMETHTAIAQMATRGFASDARSRGLLTLPIAQMWILHTDSRADTLVRRFQYGRFAAIGGAMLTRPTQISTGIKGAPDCDIQRILVYDAHGFPTQVRQTGKPPVTYVRGYSGDELIAVTTGDASLGSVLTTSFSHRQLVGCTSIANPSGKNTSYDYCGGRLCSIRNTEGNLLTRYEYETYAQNPYLFEGTNRITTLTYSNGDNDYAVSHQLLNGFGKVVASQLQGYGAEHDDITMLTYYDALMRPIRQWIPLPVDGDLSDYFYDTDLASANAASLFSDTPAYEQLIYRDDASDVPKHSFMPGAQFAMHPSLTELSCSNPDVEELKVIRWHLDGDRLWSDGYYQAGELDCTRQVDGDGRVSLTFTDCIGRVVLTRQIGSYTYYNANTYYLRDAWGNPTLVIPPMASRSLRGNNYSLDNSFIQNYCYIYGYDNQLRLTMKKLPGRHPISYAYDGDCRLVITRDGNMADQGRVAFTLYDNQGRVAVTGTADDTGVADNGNVSLPSDVTMVARRNGAAVSRYSAVESMTLEQAGYTCDNASWLLPNAQILSVSYYDDYQWIGPGVASNLSTSVPHITAPKGLPTGSLTATLSEGGYNPYIIQANYYDIDQQLVASTETSSVVDIVERDYVYNRAGQPVLITTTIRSGDASPCYSRAMTYDQFGRIRSADFLCGGESRNIGRYGYNRLGQLSSIVFQGEHSRTMDYDIHGWLRHWLSCGVEQSLSYADGIYPAYNGFISAKTTAFDGYHKRYDYEYNHLGFLTDAHYRSDDATEDFSVKYSVDLHGNFNGLRRKARCYDGTCRIVEDLDITLNGNQVRAIDNVMGYDALMETSLSIPQGDFNFGSMAYDANGNLTRDLSRDIEEITYNVANLPQRAIFGDGSRIEWTYSAAGVKLCERISDEDGSFMSRTDYVGDAIFDDRGLDRIRLPEGYVTMRDFFSEQADGLVYHAYVPDYQGNILRVVDTSTGLIEQTTDYYPYGMPHVDARGAEVNRVKFGGKELVTNRGLNACDFVARWHNVALPGFTTPDPCCETYYPLSPYTFCAANPVNFSDPTGREIIATSQRMQKIISLTLHPNDRAYLQFNKDGKINSQKLLSHFSRSINYNKLLRLNLDDKQFYTILENNYLYKDNYGNVCEGKLSPIGYDESYVEENPIRPINPVTGEDGGYGITLLPEIGESNRNSPNENAYIIINKELSDEGAAQAFAHEGFGHAYVYSYFRDRNLSGHQFIEGGIDANKTLIDRIIESILETIRSNQ